MADKLPDAAITPFDEKIDYTLRYARFVRAELAALENRYDRVLRRESHPPGTKGVYEALLRERRMYVRLYESALRDIDVALLGMQKVRAKRAATCPMVMCNEGITSREDYQAARPYMTVGTDVERCGALHVHWPSLSCSNTAPSHS